MTITVVILAFLLVTLTGLLLADDAIKESKRKVYDDAHPIDKELWFNAQLRDLQGLHRVGDELTQYDTSEHVSVAREVVR